MKTSCYFYHEVQDMGANIPTCNYYFRLGYCPCVNCEYYVDRSEVYKIVKTSINRSKRKMGKWIFLEPNGFKCSECNKYLYIACGDVKMNLCPNCGADMREGE